jgi:PAS domain S-box-containing protein
VSNQDDQKSPMTDESKEPDRLLGETRIPRRVARAAAYVQGQKVMQSLLEALAEALIVIDGSGMVVFVNQRAEELFGYGRDEVVGQPLSIYLPEKFVETHARHVSDYFEHPRKRPMGRKLELAGKHKDGRVLPVDVSLSYLDTEIGPLGLAFVTDMTLQKRAEQALQRRNEELDAFAHTVAHEINSPLGLVVGFSEFLLDAPETMPVEERRNYLGMIARNGHRMARLIEELLLFSSIRREDVELVPLDMRRIVDEALERLSHMIEEYQAQIALPDRFPGAKGYGPWVEKVWFNYISNALKYGGSPSQVELGASPQDDARVKFWVRDNGAGLTPDQKERLFVPWTRLESHNTEGHGLGLSIVQRIVEKLNGEVGVESEVGKGSLFYFILPGVE